MKSQILTLRNQGYTYNQIVDELGCSKSTVAYYCSKNQKQKMLQRQQARRKKHPYLQKIEGFCRQTQPNQWEANYDLSVRHLIRSKIKTFCREYKSMDYVKPDFSVDDVLEKFGDNPTCYLTGEPIDMNQPRTYSFDHIIPRSRGGDNSLDNLGLCTKQANQAKADMTPEELVEFCKKVIAHHNPQ